MRRQNDTFRKHARATFGELLNAVVREPALLVWLDAPANRKGHPNENLARELMELFTLGVGHYTEADVKEAARCLTGWTVEDGKFAEVADAARRRREDDPRQDGQVDRRRPGEACCSEHPATADRLVVAAVRHVLRREGGPGRGGAGAGRRAVRERDLDVGWAVGTILRSRRSSRTRTSATRVLGPAEFVVGAARALELFDPAPSTLALADWCGRMGQDLFDPPNVGGWPGGRAWVGRAVDDRAGELRRGPGRRPERRPAEGATTRPSWRRSTGSPTDANALITFHHRLLFGGDPTPALTARLAKGMDRKMVALLLSAPEDQLG